MKKIAVFILFLEGGMIYIHKETPFWDKFSSKFWKTSPWKIPNANWLVLTSFWKEIFALTAHWEHFGLDLEKVETSQRRFSAVMQISSGANSCRAVIVEAFAGEHGHSLIVPPKSIIEDSSGEVLKSFSNITVITKLNWKPFLWFHQQFPNPNSLVYFSDNAFGVKL